MLAEATNVSPEAMRWIRSFIRTRFGVDRI
jgi:hypothetical protein